ncbi:hypothetical protein DXG01_001329 [Tephrocybe rancida]|nr:hypothetical protein DXG01_001329 [Tephrocybe rancida]
MGEISGPPPGTHVLFSSTVTTTEVPRQRNTFSDCMRKTPNALVIYESSSEDDIVEQPKSKRRRLPSLSSNLLPPAPRDRPELHQGRKRTQPHVEGQWAAHVYVSLDVRRHLPLNALLDDVLSHTKETTPTLNDFWNDEPSRNRELHISLSRPIYLRAHQREDMKKAVKELSKKFSPFMVSFATFSELLNDECTRTFLTMEVGAGHQELRAMSDALTPTLKTIRQKEFYSDPRFHASIAWALLDYQNSKSTISDTSSTVAGGTLTNLPPTSVGDTSDESNIESAFSTIPSLPKDLVPALNGLFSARLSAVKTGTYDVETITVKIGKEAHTWRLSGD